MWLTWKLDRIFNYSIINKNLSAMKYWEITYSWSIFRSLFYFYWYFFECSSSSIWSSSSSNISNVSNSNNWRMPLASFSWMEDVMALAQSIWGVCEGALEELVNESTLFQEREMRLWSLEHHHPSHLQTHPSLLCTPVRHVSHGLELWRHIASV